MTDWLDLTRRAGFVSHRLIGWVYWDPVAIENYAALGPDPWARPDPAVPGAAARWPAAARPVGCS